MDSPPRLQSQKYTSFRGGLLDKKRSELEEAYGSDSSPLNTPKAAVSPARMSSRNMPVITTDQVFASKDDMQEMENPFYKGVAEDDPLALAAGSPSPAGKTRRRFNDEDEDDDDDPMASSAAASNAVSNGRSTENQEHKSLLEPDDVLKQYKQAAMGGTMASSSPTAAAYTLEEEKHSEDRPDAHPEQVFQEYNNPNVLSSTLTAQEEETRDSSIQDVDLSDDPVPTSDNKSPLSPSVTSPGIPSPASLSSPTKLVNPQPTQKRTFDDSTLTEDTAAPASPVDESNSQQQQQQSAQAMRNKATEPSVFWSELREWLQQVDRIDRVTVDEPHQLPRTLTNPNPSFTFLVRTSISLDGVRRRYSDFETLRLVLAAKYPGILLLSLPEKKAMGNKTEEFLADRARGLRIFLEKLLENEYLRSDVFTRAFLLCQPGEWESAKKRATAVQTTPDPFRPIQSSGTSLSPEDRWRAAVNMSRLPEKHEDEVVRATELLSRLEHVLKSLLTCATKCAQASKAYATSVKDLHRQFAMSQMVSSLAALQSPVEFWSDASSIEPVIIEELLVESLQKELDMVGEMKRLLETRKELMVAADQKLAILHKYEDECETMKKTGQHDRATRSAQKVQDALKQVKQADFKLETMTKAMFLAGLGTFVPARIEALSMLMGRFAFGEVRFGDLMKSVWLGVVASLRLDLTQVEADARQPMEAVRRRVPERFRTAFNTSALSVGDQQHQMPISPRPQQQQQQQQQSTTSHVSSPGPMTV